MSSKSWVAIVFAAATILATACSGSSTGERAAVTDTQRAADAAAQSRIGDDRTRESMRGKPRATTNGIRGGGGDLGAFDVPVEQLPNLSEVAVRARVTRIGPSVLNTPSGEWDAPAGASAEELHNLFAELVPYTPVHLEVLEVLAARHERTFDVAPGDELTVTLLGGEKAFTLSEAEARAIGITVPVEEGNGPTANQSLGSKTPPRAPIAFTSTLQPSAYLVEGDAVIAFLSHGTIQLYPGGVPKDVIVSLRPEGFGLYRETSADGDVFRNAASGKEVTGEALRNTAAALQRASGPAQLMGGGTY
jgi:hypothetical protein